MLGFFLFLYILWIEVCFVIWTQKAKYTYYSWEISEAGITLLLKLTQESTKKENESYRLFNINAQILNKILESHIQESIERTIRCSQIIFFLGIQRRNLLADSCEILY